MKKFVTRLIRSSEKTMAILGDRWPQAAKKGSGYDYSKPFTCVKRKHHERPTVIGGVCIIRCIGTVLHLERDAWSIVKRPRQAANEYPPRFGSRKEECRVKKMKKKKKSSPEIPGFLFDIFWRLCGIRVSFWWTLPSFNYISRFRSGWDQLAGFGLDQGANREQRVKKQCLV